MKKDAGRVVAGVIFSSLLLFFTFKMQAARPKPAAAAAAAAASSTTTATAPRATTRGELQVLNFNPYDEGRMKEREACYQTQNRLRREANTLDAEGLLGFARDQDRLFRDVKGEHVPELVLDASVYSEIASLALRRLKDQRAAVTFAPNAFIEKLTLEYGRDGHAPISWGKIARDFAANTAKSSAGCYFLRDALSREPPPPKIRARADAAAAGVERARHAPLVRPEEKEAEGRQQMSEVDIRVKEMHEALLKAHEKGEEYLYFEFVTDVTSFGQTIENIFALSMLVNSGHVGIVIKDEQPYIQVLHRSGPAGKSSQAGGKSNGKQYTQHIVKLDTKKWKEIIDVYRLERTLFRCSAAMNAQDSQALTQAMTQSTSKRARTG